MFNFFFPPPPFFFFFFFYLFIFFPNEPKDYIIDNSGIDNDECSSDKPCKSIHKVVELASASSQYVNVQVIFRSANDAENNSITFSNGYFNFIVESSIMNQSVKTLSRVEGDSLFIINAASVAFNEITFQISSSAVAILDSYVFNLKNGWLNINNCNFTGVSSEGSSSSTPLNKPLISFGSGQLILNSSKFTDFELASGDGCVISGSIIGGSDLSIAGGSFTSCSTKEGKGGALCLNVESGSVGIGSEGYLEGGSQDGDGQTKQNCVFKNCKATVYGGAICLVLLGSSDISFSGIEFGTASEDLNDAPLGKDFYGQGHTEFFSSGDILDKLQHSCDDLTSTKYYANFTDVTYDGYTGTNLLHYFCAPYSDKSVTEYFVSGVAMDNDNCGWKDLPCFFIDVAVERAITNNINTVVVMNEMAGVYLSNVANINSDVSLTIKELSDFGTIAVNVLKETNEEENCLFNIKKGNLNINNINFNYFDEAEGTVIYRVINIESVEGVTNYEVKLENVTFCNFGGLKNDDTVIRCSSSAYTITMTNCKVFNNESITASVLEGSDVIKNNVCGWKGGEFYLKNTKLNMNNVEITNCSRGGLLITGISTVTIVSSSFTNNNPNIKGFTKIRRNIYCDSETEEKGYYSNEGATQTKSILSIKTLKEGSDGISSSAWILNKGCIITKDDESLLYSYFVPSFTNVYYQTKSNKGGYVLFIVGTNLLPCNVEIVITLPASSTTPSSFTSLSSSSLSNAGTVIRSNFTAYNDTVAYQDFPNEVFKSVAMDKISVSLCYYSEYDKDGNKINNPQTDNSQTLESKSPEAAPKGAFNDVYGGSDNNGDPSDGGDGKKNLSWISGPIVGVVVIGAALGGVFLYRYIKNKKSKKEQGETGEGNEGADKEEKEKEDKNDASKGEEEMAEDEKVNNLNVTSEYGEQNEHSDNDEQHKEKKEVVSVNAEEESS